MLSKRKLVLIIAALGIAGALIGAFMLKSVLISSGSLILAAIVICPIAKQEKKEYDEEQDCLKKDLEVQKELESLLQETKDDENV